MKKLLLMAIFLNYIVFTLAQIQNDTINKSESISFTMVIVLNGSPEEHLFPKFVKFKDGNAIDTLQGIYFPGRIDFVKEKYENFVNLNYDSIFIEFYSHQRLFKKFSIYDYKYRFEVFQEAFNSPYQAYQIERMAIKYYRKKYFKRSRNFKGGFVVYYIGEAFTIPCKNYVKRSDDE